MTSGPVLTDGFDCYVRIRRGVYHRVGRRGQRLGITCTDFTPRPRWKPARKCAFVIAEHGLTCPNCGHYDMFYAETGERSYCDNQGKGWS